MCSSMFGVLTYSFLSAFLESKPFFGICSFSVSLLYFSAPQLLFSELLGFNSDVPLFFSHFNLASCMFFQPHLCVSSDDPHHTMIGTFSLYIFVFSDIRNSDDPYSGPCLCFLFLSLPSDSPQCFGPGIFQIRNL